MKDDRPITDTDQGEFDKLPETEPKSGKLVGVWFTDQTVWGYRGTLPVVIETGASWFGSVSKSYHTTTCPSCIRNSLEGKRVLRWLILPP